MENDEQVARKSRDWRARLGYFALGAFLGALTLWILAVILPGDLPGWVGYALATVAFGFVYVQNFRAWRSKKAVATHKPE